MKSWKVKFTLNGTGGVLETVIQAKTNADVRKIMEGQYGSSLRSVTTITEIK